MSFKGCLHHFARLLLLVFTCTSLAQQAEALKYSVTEVAEGLYVLEGVGGFTGGNIALSVGDDGVVMIDDGVPKVTDIMQETIKRITGQPVDFLINTHFHWDHTGNNAVMARDGAKIFAHDNARKRLRLKPGQSDKAALPVFTFSKEMHFYLNGHETNIIHVANAHTDGDVLVWFKSLNVIHTGDVFVNGMFPYIDLKNGGTITGMIAAHQTILDLADAQTKIIPGHGQLTDISKLQATILMLEDSKKRVAALIARNKTIDEVVQLNPLQIHHAYSGDFIDTEAMTRQVYRSLLQENIL